MIGKKSKEKKTLNTNETVQEIESLINSIAEAKTKCIDEAVAKDSPLQRETAVLGKSGFVSFRSRAAVRWNTETDLVKTEYKTELLKEVCPSYSMYLELLFEESEQLPLIESQLDAAISFAKRKAKNGVCLEALSWREVAAFYLRKSKHFDRDPLDLYLFAKNRKVLETVGRQQKSRRVTAFTEVEKWTVQTALSDEVVDPREIGLALPGKTLLQLMHQIARKQHPFAVQRKFTLAEDFALYFARLALGSNDWGLLSADFVPTQSFMKCRERFQSHLRPALVGDNNPFSEHDRLKLLQSMQRHGPTNYKEISKEFPDRNNRCVRWMCKKLFSANLELFTKEN